MASLRLNHVIPCYRASNDRDAPTFTVEQAAERFGVHQHTIYLWIRPVYSRQTK